MLPKLGVRDVRRGILHTDLIQLNQEVFRTILAQELFGCTAVRAVGFAEDGYSSPIGGWLAYDLH